MTFGSLGNALGPIVGSAAYAAMLPREQGSFKSEPYSCIISIFLSSLLFIVNLYLAFFLLFEGRLVFVTGAVIILTLGCVAGRFLKDVS